MIRTAALGLLIALGAWAAGVSAREWSDSTGHYKIDAEMIGFNDAMVVLKRTDQRLVGVPVEKLCKADQAYVQSKEAADSVRATIDKPQAWTMRSGLKVIGKVVDYARKDFTIQRRRGKVYVNDRLLDNMPEIARRMTPKIINHFEKTALENTQDIEQWILKLQGAPKTYTLEGVMLELENGDEQGVPFFFFSDEDLKVLQPGWERWVAAHKQQAQHDQEALMLQAQAHTYQQNQKFQQQVAVMQLQLQGYEAGLFDLWEVSLYPGPGVARSPMMVVVPARDSRTAIAEAVSRNPGFVAGPVAKVRRK